MDIQQAVTGAQVEEVRRLFEEYWTEFGFTPCFQNFSEELAALPGSYAPPDGRLALAVINGEPAGCAALRRFDARRGEAKRLFVRPAFRGSGLGRALLDWIIREARAAGYRELVGDSLPVMAKALGMYRRMGFEETRREGDTIYLRLPL